MPSSHCRLPECPICRTGRYATPIRDPNNPESNCHRHHCECGNDWICAYTSIQACGMRPNPNNCYRCEEVDYDEDAYTNPMNEFKDEERTHHREDGT